jgi:DNA-directed RNA polymerase specialized sigma24 family protein/ribosome-associated translation inhibitor RaiA
MHWVFNGCSDWVKEILTAHWEKKASRLRRLVTHFPAEQTQLRLTVYQHPDPLRYEVRGVLHLPMKTLVAETRSKDPHAVLEEVGDALVRELKRHKEQLRRDYLYRRRARRRADLSAAGPLLERDQAGGRREAFFDLLRPLLRSLHTHARRGLRIMELEGTIGPGEVTPTDIVHDTITLAWDRFADRPAKQPLELWLIELLHERMSRLAEVPAHVSIHQPVAAERPDEGEWPFEFMEQNEPLTLEDIYPDHDGSDVWHRLEHEEQRDLVLRLLGEFPEQQRQAFLLRTTEGYDIGEIAMIQDRSAQAVQEDIRAAAHGLRSRLDGLETRSFWVAVAAPSATLGRSSGGRFTCALLRLSEPNRPRSPCPLTPGPSPPRGEGRLFCPARSSDTLTARDLVNPVLDYRERIVPRRLLGNRHQVAEVHQHAAVAIEHDDSQVGPGQSEPRPSVSAWQMLDGT